MNKKLIYPLFIALLISFFAGLFFPQVVQAYWTTPQSRVEVQGGGDTKYSGSGYGGNAYYYYQPGNGRSLSWSSWGSASTNQYTTFNWTAYIPAAHYSGKAYVEYIGEVNSNEINQAPYTDTWVAVLSEYSTQNSSLFLSNECVNSCSSLEVEWDNIYYSYWYQP